MTHSVMNALRLPFISIFGTYALDLPLMRHERHLSASRLPFISFFCYLQARSDTCFHAFRAPLHPPTPHSTLRSYLRAACSSPLAHLLPSPSVSPRLSRTRSLHFVSARPLVCAGWLQYRNRMTGWNVLGLIMATAGTLLFHSSRHAAGAIRSLQPSHQPC